MDDYYNSKETGTSLKDLKKNGTVIINTANFTPKNLKLAEWEVNPLEDDTLSEYRAIKIDMTKRMHRIPVRPPMTGF